MSNCRVGVHAQPLPLDLSEDQTMCMPLSRSRFRLSFLLAAGILMLMIPEMSSASPAKKSCPATPHDEIGPFYRPGAPLRSVIGRGYRLEGTVRSTRGCRPIPGARIEVWQAGPGGVYDDAHRATLYSDRRGRYRLETSLPPPYLRRPPHIHILVDTKGHAGLITQHYPAAGSRGAKFDLVLEPE